MTLPPPSYVVTSGRVSGTERRRTFTGACAAVAYVASSFAQGRPWEGDSLYYPPRAYTAPVRGYGRLIYRHPEDRNRG